MNQSDQIVLPQKQKSGCWSFTCGCLVGILFTLFLLVTGGLALNHFSGYLFESAVSTVYKDSIRPELEKSLPDSEKSAIMKEVDALVEKFPTMPTEEKMATFKEVLGKIVMSNADRADMEKIFQEQLEKQKGSNEAIMEDIENSIRKTVDEHNKLIEKNLNNDVVIDKVD